MSKSRPAVPTVDLIPSRGVARAVRISVVRTPPPDTDVIGLAVDSAGDVPAAVGLDREALSAAGFDGAVGQTLVLPRADGPALIAVGIGDRASRTAATLRDAAAALARAAGKRTRLATDLTDLAGVDATSAGQAVVEGVLLARYRYDAFKATAAATPVRELALVAGTRRTDGVTAGAERGRVTASVGMLARDVANAPAGRLTATRFADIAAAIGPDHGLEVEVFDRADIVRMACGGVLGVNAGSTEEPRIIKLRYRPRKRARKGVAARHLVLVGKGIMYDSGGISLKPSDAMHALMKMDMAGAGAILAAMTGLAALDAPVSVTGFLMCTDNMPSGSATRLGDVLTIRGGTTVEVMNTDAEGRLVLADGLVLATEERPDAIIDIATLTGAAMRALGTAVAAVIGTDQRLVDQVLAAGRIVDEPAWQLPLERRYRKTLDSDIADMRNLTPGADNAGAIIAALFLADFVGEIPWAHLDIAGTMNADADESWRSKGATGYGARLLLDVALHAPTTA